MTHIQDNRLLAGLFALAASLAVVAAEQLSDLELSGLYGESFRQQVMESQNQWREPDDGNSWRAEDAKPSQGRIEFGYEEIREHERIQEMLDQSTHSFGPGSSTILNYRF